MPYPSLQRPTGTLDDYCILLISSLEFLHLCIVLYLSSFYVSQHEKHQSLTRTFIPLKTKFP